MCAQPERLRVTVTEILLGIFIEARLTAGAAEVDVLALVLRVRSARADRKTFTGDWASGIGTNFLRGVEDGRSLFGVSLFTAISATVVFGRLGKAH